jgi:hypothetical protein
MKQYIDYFVGYNRCNSLSIVIVIYRIIINKTFISSEYKLDAACMRTSLKNSALGRTVAEYFQAPTVTKHYRNIKLVRRNNRIHALQTMETVTI